VGVCNYNLNNNETPKEKDMTKRRELRIQKETHDLRIFKSYDGKEIFVIRHELSPELTKIFGTRTTEIQGDQMNSYQATGRWSYTLKEVAENHS
jgi:hypothetical protein